MDQEHIYFENYAATWDRDRKENPEKLSWMIDLLHLPRNGYILDIGAGTGILVPYLKKVLSRQGIIEELDYSHNMLEQARQKFGHLPGLIFTEGNILRISLPENRYDAILCLNVYPHIGNEILINKLTRSLKPGGFLAIFHDQSRQKVNGLHEESNVSGTAPLPPVDILEMQLISAGLDIELAMDTDELYLVKGTKKGHKSSGTDTKTINHAKPYTETKKIIHRLARISGHLEGIRKMIEEGRGCSEILIQISAVNSALINTSKVILQDHIDHCLADAVTSNDKESIDKLKKAIDQLIKG
jgi:DNA-binding FrmR family transcriptional regulator/protein-L-isoaspartate O-methyltransferase